MAASSDKRCCVIRNASSQDGKQGLSYSAGISRETVGSEKLCLHVVTIPPGGRASAHYHEGHDTAIYLMSGSVDQLWGDQLENHDRVTAGDYVFIPAGVPHVVMNTSPTEPATAAIARSDPASNESVVLTPELEAVVDLFLSR